MEQKSSQEGLDVSPINDTKWVTEFEGEIEHFANWIGHREGQHRNNGQLQMADSI
jgi:hypothetical protein